MDEKLISDSSQTFGSGGLSAIEQLQQTIKSHEESDQQSTIKSAPITQEILQPAQQEGVAVKGKRKTVVFWGLFLFFLIVAVTVGFFYYMQLKSQPASINETKVVLNQEDLVALNKSSVFRIIQHVKGRAKLPNFDVDLTSFKIIPREGIGEEIPFDEYISGSGFIVSKDGYILTNSHVISNANIKYAIAGDYGIKVLNKKLAPQIEKLNKIDQAEQYAIGYDLGKQMMKYLLEKGDFQMEKKLFVLNPFTSRDDLQESLKDAFSARVISVNDNFFEDGKDSAVIKIDQDNLPEIKLGNSDEISVSNKISIFGFPASADFNNKSWAESTFTSGTISALKSSDDISMKLFQTDAKVSPGSSGGPLLNNNGEAIGIITYQSSNEQRQGGDNFAFGIPMNAVKKFIDSYSVKDEFVSDSVYTNYYASHFLKGLSLMEDKRCKTAVEEFQKARTVNFLTKASLNYLDSKIETCNQFIASGTSIDSKWDEMKNGLNNKIYMIIGMALAAIIIIGLLISLIVERKRLQKDENEISKLISIANKLNG